MGKQKLNSILPKSQILCYFFFPLSAQTNRSRLWIHSFSSDIIIIVCRLQQWQWLRLRGQWWWLRLRITNLQCLFSPSSWWCTQSECILFVYTIFPSTHLSISCSFPFLICFQYGLNYIIMTCYGESILLSWSLFLWEIHVALAVVLITAHFPWCIIYFPVNIYFCCIYLLSDIFS